MQYVIKKRVLMASRYVETHSFGVFFKILVDSFPDACRMRITSEGQVTHKAAATRSNRLKLLKKLSFKILQKAVDREVRRCRIRLLETSSKPVTFRRFPGHGND